MKQQNVIEREFDRLCMFLYRKKKNFDLEKRQPFPGEEIEIEKAYLQLNILRRLFFLNQINTRPLKKSRSQKGFKSFGEFLQAVAKASKGKGIDKRLISNRGICAGA